MPLTIDTDVKGVGQVLSSYRLAVPLHQRPFAWTREEVSLLWEDLTRAQYEDPEGYFIGPIVLGEPVQSQRFSVIDGQQRLATASLLFAASAAVFRSRGDEERAALLHQRYLGEKDIVSLERQPKLLLGEDDDNYFRQLVDAAVSGAGLPEPADRKPSQGLIRKAYDFLLERIAAAAASAGESWSQPLLALLDFVHASVEVIVVKVGTDQNAYLIFETLNDRGLRLTTSDLLKNHLFRQAGDRLDEVRKSWTEMASALAAIEPEDPTPQFLRHFWISSRGIVREKALYRTIGREIRTSPAAVQLAEGLARSAERYAALTNPLHSNWRATAVRNALRLLHLFRVVTPLPLLLASLEQLDDGAFADIAPAVSRWSIRLAISGGLGSGTVEDSYGEVARKVRRGEINGLDQLRSKLTSILPSDETFHTAFSTKSLRNRRQARFLLAELEREARRQAGRTGELEANLDESQVNLEHVMPHRPRPGAWEHVSADSLQLYVERLGNFALMLRDENTAAGSDSFDKKREFYSRSELILTAEISAYEKWNAETIAERQKRLAELAVRVWPL